MMGTHKYLTITFEASLETEVKEVLEKANVDNFIKHDKFVGKMRACPRMLDTHIWPGYFNRYIVEVDNEEFERLKPLLKELSSKHCKDGFRVLVIPVEEVI